MDEQQARVGVKPSVTLQNKRDKPIGQLDGNLDLAQKLRLKPNCWQQFQTHKQTDWSPHLCQWKICCGCEVPAACGKNYICSMEIEQKIFVVTNFVMYPSQLNWHFIGIEPARRQHGFRSKNSHVHSLILNMNLTKPKPEVYQPLWIINVDQSSKTFDHAKRRMISASVHVDLLKFIWQTVWENKRTISILIFQLARDKRVLSSRLFCLILDSALSKCQSPNEKKTKLKWNGRIRMQCHTSIVSLS